LCDGATKKVFQVFNDRRGAVEAISVMNVDDLCDRGMDVVVINELEISMLCSAMVALNICPNLVQIYSIFRTGFDAPAELWNNTTLSPQLSSVPPKITIPRSGKSRSRFQYIRMELCSGGDLEDFVRRSKVLDVCQIRKFFFQMCFSLYCCRDKLMLRHFDIKLLNFFVSSSRSLQWNAVCVEDFNGMYSESNKVSLEYYFGNRIFALDIGLDSLEVIKLADFGKT
jgi:serine/threonine protein kinase